MKQTPVEWLVEQLSNYDSKMVELFKNEIKQAKEMESQQKGYSDEDLKQAFFSGCQSERQFKTRIKCWEEFIEHFKNK
jgi:hypothetical protein